MRITEIAGPMPKQVDTSDVRSRMLKVFETEGYLTPLELALLDLEQKTKLIDKRMKEQNK